MVHDPDPSKKNKSLTSLITWMIFKNRTSHFKHTVLTELEAQAEDGQRCSTYHHQEEEAVTSQHLVIWSCDWSAAPLSISHPDQVQYPAVWTQSQGIHVKQYLYLCLTPLKVSCNKLVSPCASQHFKYFKHISRKRFSTLYVMKFTDIIHLPIWNKCWWMDTSRKHSWAILAQAPDCFRRINLSVHQMCCLCWKYSKRFGLTGQRVQALKTPRPLAWCEFTPDNHICLSHRCSTKTLFWNRHLMWSFFNSSTGDVTEWKHI